MTTQSLVLMFVYNARSFTVVLLLVRLYTLRIRTTRLIDAMYNKQCALPRRHVQLFIGINSRRKIRRRLIDHLRNPIDFTVLHPGFEPGTVVEHNKFLLGLPLA